MSDWKELETYNSQGLVTKVDSLNSSKASLVSQAGDDSSLDISYEQSMSELYLATANGLHPSLVSKMFHISSKSSKHLSQFLNRVFSHCLRTGELETCLLLVKQFQQHRYYSKAIVSTLDFIVKSNISMNKMEYLVMLMTRVYQMLEPAGQELLTHVMVDTLVRWLTPKQLDRKRELMLVVSAKTIITKIGPDIAQSSLSGYKLVYSQIRAALVGEGCGAETRAVMLDILVIMARQGLHREEFGFILDLEQNMSDQNCNVIEDLEKEGEVSKEKKSNEGGGEGSEDTKPETVPVAEEKAMLFNAGFVCTYAEDVANIKAALEKECDEMVTPVENSGKVAEHKLMNPDKIELISPAMFENMPSYQMAMGGKVLGHLVSIETEVAFSVEDQCTIGRDPFCSIVLSGKEVSRLHARVLSSQGQASIVSESKTNKVRVNGIAVDEVAMLLIDGDKVQVGKEAFIWRDDSIDFNSTQCGKNENSDIKIESNEINVEVMGFSKDNLGKDEDVNSDTESVVVEMVNFI